MLFRYIFLFLSFFILGCSSIEDYDSDINIQASMNESFSYDQAYTFIEYILPYIERGRKIAIKEKALIKELSTRKPANLKEKLIVKKYKEVFEEDNLLLLYDKILIPSISLMLMEAIIENPEGITIDLKSSKDIYNLSDNDVIKYEDNVVHFIIVFNIRAKYDSIRDLVKNNEPFETLFTELKKEDFSNKMTLIQSHINLSKYDSPTSVKEEIIADKPNTETVVRTGKNPSRQEIFQTCINVGRKYNIPPEILYAMIYAESEFHQFIGNGRPFISFDGGIGLTQITPGKASVNFDKELAKNDYRYNIDIGAKVLLDKYNISWLPKINGSKNLLETWYFALWAYNGYSTQNNPNCLPMYVKALKRVKKTAYQDRLIQLAKKDLNINITPIPKDILPSSGLPKNLIYDLPEIYRKSNFI